MNGLIWQYLGHYWNKSIIFVLHDDTDRTSTLSWRYNSNIEAALKNPPEIEHDLSDTSRRREIQVFKYNVLDLRYDDMENYVFIPTHCRERI